MALATPAEREFRVLRRGFIRDRIVLDHFREGLRALVNPETGNLFTEEEIARATREGSRWYNEAQAIDDYGQGEQRNALYLADQIQYDRATGRWLLNFHGRLWNASHLPASGGSGLVRVQGPPGTIVVGDPVPNTPGAYKARDPAGNLYQVFTTSAVGPSSFVDCVLAAISTGAATNIPAGTVLTWTERDPNMVETASVVSDFTGGNPRETDPELGARIGSIIRHRPGAGNSAHVNAWGREASSAIEQAFVYPSALHAGSTIVAFTQKRSTATGPLARLPSPATLAAGIAYITPPTSPNFPARSFVIGTPWVSDPVDVVIKLSNAGWTDPQPFPAFHATTPFVSDVTSQTLIEITCPGDSTLPGQVPLATLIGSDAPGIMLWNTDKSRWEKLSVGSIEDLGGSVFEVTLTAPPPFTIAPNAWVSPNAVRRLDIAVALEQYFDELGPGDFFDVNIDPRGGRCRRFPDPLEEKPYRAGAIAAQRVIEALGDTASGAELASMSKTSPGFQTALQLGPKMLTLGRVAIYGLTT